MSCIDTLPLTSLPVGRVRSGENALFSFSPNLAVGRNDPFTELGIHRTQGDQIPTNEEQPHEENSLDEILQLRGLRSSLSDYGMKARVTFRRKHELAIFDKAQATFECQTKRAGAMMRTSQSESEFVSPGRESVVAQRRFALRPCRLYVTSAAAGATEAPPVMVCGQNNGG